MFRPLPWHIGFAVGHAEIDAQHRELIRLINEIIGAVEQRTIDKLPAMLSTLGDAAAEHFQSEISALRELIAGRHEGPKGRRWSPRLVQQLADAGIDQHQAQHAILLKDLSGFRMLPPPDLCQRLKEWFVDHAIRQDARLRPIFQTL